MSGRYPDAPNLQQFWQNLSEGRNSVREVPADRWNVNDYFDPNPAAPGKIYCKWLGALDDIDRFDPLFFGISPAEAEAMDPQHRLFLEEGYHAFEDAGYGPRALSRVNCGVYMGIMSYEYAFLLQKWNAALTNTGNSFAIGAARLPYFLNLKGPAIPIDTACSSSLVATHLACQALRNGEVDMALAGGVSLYLAPESYVGMCAAGMVSPDGQCKAFDDDANGFVPGEGAGALVLKRLSDAERDGDHIHGLIIGSGINQDGKTNGITAPSVNSQIELAQSIYDHNGITPTSISYVEAHGTGTKLGDPIELEALATVFRRATDQRQFCALGSVKSNIGHTSAAAGVAGIQKTLLAMRHQQLPASLHFRKPNRHFDFDASPFFVNTALRPWQTASGTPRRAAVSSFGFSGTNAHLVLEEYTSPAARPASSSSVPVPVILSARRPEQLRDLVRDLHDYLHPIAASVDLRSLAYTLHVGRAELDERVVFEVRSIDELLQALNAYLAGTAPPDRAQADFDWTPPPKRMSLPGYPFARLRCWPGAPPQAEPLRIPLLDIEQLDPHRAARDFAPVALDELLGELVWATLHTMGVFRSRAFTLPQAMAAGRIQPSYERWLKEALADQGRRGKLTETAGRFTLLETAPPSLDTAWKMWDLQKRIESRDPLRRPQFPLVEACLRSLPAILRGEKPAVEVMFPNASLSLVEPFYKGNPVSDLFNEILSRTLEECIEQRLAADPTARVRIIEVGAGTGGMTTAVLPRLVRFGDRIAEYCHTDVSKSFQFHAEQAFGGHPFFRAQLLDIERPPDEQAIAAGEYDFVIASNVLHATRNIRRVVHHARALLRPNGILLLNEISRKSLLGHITFGLLEGWWRNEDDSLRMPGSPALYPETWERVLTEEGFAQVVFPCTESHELGQHILAACLQPGMSPPPPPKQFLSFSERWHAVELPEAGAWSERLQAVEDQHVVLMSTDSRQLAAFQSVFDRIAGITGRRPNSVTHVPLPQAKLPPGAGPLTVFLCLPEILADGMEQLQTAYSAVQTVMREARARAVRFYCLYQDPPTGPWLFGEALAGLFKSAMAESVDHRYRAICHDANSAADGLTALRAVQEWLCDETLDLPPAMVPMVRYTAGARQELRVLEETLPASPPPLFRKGATYLLTGALGPAGTAVCEQLGRRYQARLVLLSRRTEQDAEPALQRIRAAGATVVYRSVDITDRSAMQQVFAGLQTDGITLHGVIHMARQVADAPIVEKPFGNFRETMAAKVTGAVNLDALTTGHPLEFFLLYSSMASFGIQGSPDYAFSTSWLNAFARMRQQQVDLGRRAGCTVSLCWGQWDVDGAVSPDQLPARLERVRSMGMDLIDAPSAITIMAAGSGLESSVLAAMAVSDAARARRAMGLEPHLNPTPDEIADALRAYEQKEWDDQRFARFLDSVVDADLSEATQQRILRLIDPVEPQPAPASVVASTQTATSSPIREAILASVRKTLKIPESELDWNRPLQDYGLDSIVAMQLATTLENTLKRPVQPRWLIDYPTLTLLLEKLQGGK